MRPRPWYIAPAPPVPITGKPHRHFERLASARPQSFRGIARRQIDTAGTPPIHALLTALIFAAIGFGLAAAFFWGPLE